MFRNIGGVGCDFSQTGQCQNILTAGCTMHLSFFKADMGQCGRCGQRLINKLSLVLSDTVVCHFVSSSDESC